MTTMTRQRSPLIEVIGSFGLLGITAFGGPTAHLGYFREEFVARRKWLSEQAYAEVVALAQFLPGPASSQVGMALGYHRAGWAGMMAAWLMFTLPSAIALGAFGLFLTAGDAQQGWIGGLLAAAVAVVFHAVSGMAKAMASTGATATIAVVAGIIVLAVPGSWTHLVVIIGAGLLGVLVLPADPATDSEDMGLRPVSLRAAAVALGLFIALFAAAASLGGRAAAYFHAGSLVFGGGHVVLPLLERLTVATGWIDQAEFLAGYSAAQAVPGPLFTFAAYLGAVDRGVAGAVVATVAIFAPTALLMIGGMHFWGRMRHLNGVRKAVGAINAAVVGLLGAALWDPVITHGITGTASLAIAAGCWLGLAVWKLPPWLVAAGAALAGAALL
ncbi:chromate transporter, chromate ion transporter family [Corynebacterium testudinoris]|uniref:Chromate transporter, chromate ion transporter family n=2 Tax=Corynebacterium testudinoris TaxID=136857 RepID=A0A0G3H7W9_9CORY|nr:chromate transporter, chromate ion transporter family [Corynebacterium testudinoris]